MVNDLEDDWGLLRLKRRRRRTTSTIDAVDLYDFWAELGVYPVTASEAPSTDDDPESYTPEQHRADLIASGLDPDLADFAAWTVPNNFDLHGRVAAADEARFERVRAMERFGAAIASALREHRSNDLISSVTEQMTPRNVITMVLSLTKRRSIGRDLPDRLRERPLGPDSLTALRRGYEQSVRRRRRP